MANQKHLDILKQSIEVWNRWRRKNPKITPDLSGANLVDADLSGATLIGANLSQATLIGVNLSGRNFSSQNLSGADLRQADLSDADLRDADLSGADLSSAGLRDAKLAGATIDGTTFANNDLSCTRGLEVVEPVGPSHISTNTLVKSKGQISESFLRGCGLSDWEIESAKLYNPDLSNEEINNIQYKTHDLRVLQAIQISPLFISYSHNDVAFVDTIEKHLTKQGIRFWRDVHHAVAGRLERQIDAAIYLNDVVLLVLSEHSTSSDWVEHEARKAREKEKKTGKDALCPVALDDSWKTCRWPERLREQIMEYNILDFSNWQDDVYFQRMFGKLLEGLNLFYK